jgi:hypothetical protein
MPLRLGGGKLDGWAPQQHARACADATAMARAKPLAVITLEPNHILWTVTIYAYNGQHGQGIAAAPTCVVGGIGHTVLTWAPAYTDDYGMTTPTRIRHAKATIVNDRGMTNWAITSPNVVHLYTWDGGGAARDNAVTLVVR